MQTRQFNAQQQNAVEQFNINAEMAVSQFNAQQENARQQFNASNGVLISQANAEARNKITTIDNATQNAVNQFNAQSALGFSKVAYEKEWQTYNDIMQYAWLTGENELNRGNEITKAILSKNAKSEESNSLITAALISAITGVALETDLLESLFGIEVNTNNTGANNTTTNENTSGTNFVGKDTPTGLNVATTTNQNTSGTNTIGKDTPTGLDVAP